MDSRRYDIHNSQISQIIRNCTGLAETTSELNNACVQRRNPELAEVGVNRLVIILLYHRLLLYTARIAHAISDYVARPLSRQGFMFYI